MFVQHIPIIWRDLLSTCNPTLKSKSIKSNFACNSKFKLNSTFRFQFNFWIFVTVRACIPFFFLNKFSRKMYHYICPSVKKLRYKIHRVLKSGWNIESNKNSLHIIPSILAVISCFGDFELNGFCCSVSNVESKRDLQILWNFFLTFKNCEKNCG